MVAAGDVPGSADVGRLAHHDPAVALRAVRALRKLADFLERVHVQHARDLGWTWQDIAMVLDVTRQTVHKKHGGSRAEDSQ